MDTGALLYFAKCMAWKKCLRSAVPCKMTVYRILIKFKMICSVMDGRKVLALMLFCFEAWFILSKGVNSKNNKYCCCEHHHAFYEVCLYDLEIGV
jgi:hypothetical protein